MQLADTPFRALVVGAGVLIVLLLIRIRFYGDFELPPKPPRPVEQVVDAKSVAKSINRSSDAYNEYLRKDAASFGIARVSPQTMSAIFPYQVDSESRSLEVGQSAEILGLLLTLSEQKIRGAKRSHLVLSIENKGHKALAYRVKTRPSGGAGSCSKMSQIPHNAVALAPGAVEKRAECLYRKDSKLEISQVEIVTLPELGFHYLSAVPADVLGLDPRHTQLHKGASDTMVCEILQSASMRNAVLAGEISWRDQVDFYARHRCKTYSLPSTYKAFQRDGEQNLPFSDADL